MDIGGTIIANSPSGGNCDTLETAITDWGYNLTDDESCGFSTDDHDIIETDTSDVGFVPNGLHDNGGPTDTIALQPGSPAIDQIPLNYTDSGAGPNLCLAGWLDQRGYPRPDNSESVCDIGAFETGIQPTTLTVQSASGTYGGTANLSATLTDSNGTGIANEPVTFYLNGTAVCGGTSQLTCPTTGDGTNGTTLGVATLSAVSLSGIDAGSYPSTGSCNATTASDGVFASFGGDATYQPSSGCNTLTVNAVTPTLSTTPNPSSTTVGVASLVDSATLSSGVNAGGTITFYLFAPGATSTTPTSSTVYSDTVTVTGNGTYATGTGTNPGGYATTETGTYHWVVVYSGDTNNNGVTSTFGDESVTVNAVTPTLSTTPNPSSTTFGAAHLGDSATLSDGYDATGTITFDLFAPGVTPNGTNSNTVYSDTVTVNGNGMYNTSTGTDPGGYTPTTTGTYQWVAIYAGDSNNKSVTSAFGDEPASVGTASITTTLTSSANPSTTGQSVTFTATITVTSPGAGTPSGTVTFQDNGTAIPTCGSVSVSTTTETATCQTNSLSQGIHTITAIYSGDHTFLGSTGTLQQDVSLTVPHGKTAYDIESANWYCNTGGIACIPTTDSDASQCVTMTPCPSASYGAVEAFGPPTSISNGIPDELILACVHGTRTGYQIGYLDVLSHQGTSDYPGGIDGTADPGMVSGKGTVIGGGGENNPSQPSSVVASALDARTGIRGTVTGTQNTDNTTDTVNSGELRITISGRLWTVINGQTPVRNTTSSTISCTVGGSQATDLQDAGRDTDALAEGILESSLGDTFFLPTIAPPTPSE